MANKNWLRVLVILLAFGMTFICFIGCSKNVDSNLNGEWIWSSPVGERKYKFKSGNYEVFFNGAPSPNNKGTYTTSDGKITFYLTHRYGVDYGLDEKWYSKNKFEAAMKNGLVNNTSLKIENLFPMPFTREYTVSANTLTMDNNGFTKVASSTEKSASTGKSSVSASALVGRWYLDKGPSGYPKDVDLLKDGTGIAEDAGFTWKIENGRFYIIHPFFGLSAIYNISGSTLTLTKDNGEVLIYLKK